MRAADALALSEAIGTPDLGLPLTAQRLLVADQLERRHRDRLPVLVDRDDRQKGAVRVAPLPGQRILGLHPHPNLHRRPPRSVDACRKRHELADVDRDKKRHPINRRRDDRSVRVADSREPGSLVTQLHHGAAVNEAGDVRLLGSHPDRERCLTLA